MKKQEHDAIWQGIHNADIQRSIARLETSKSYKDLSTICIIPTPGGNPASPVAFLPTKVCVSIWNLMAPMNNKFLRFTIEGKEVGDAYNESVGVILEHPELSKWKYLLTIEHDNLPPPDGLLKLYESIEKYDAVSGLYWTKGETGQPMIYGDPKEFPKNFRPQVPIPETVQECNGLGMGFTLFRLAMFRKVDKPWFKTVQQFTPGVGIGQGTQDLFFFEKAGRLGFRFAVDNRIKVGHLDLGDGTIW
jgi:hypothetical protein